MDNENFDIDHLLEDDQLFKPLTEGLGFHHSIKDKKEVKSDLNSKKVELKEQLETRAKDIQKKNKYKTNKESNSVSMGELAPFYKEEKKKEQIQLNIEQPVPQTINSASLFTRFGAWVVDSIIVISMITVALFSMILISEIPLSFLRDSFLDIDLLMSFALISLMVYTFYFTFFDKTLFSTPGKRLFHLKVMTIKNKPISLVQAFSRVLITLLSVFTLGLGCILRVQDKLTDTMVVSK